MRTVEVTLYKFNELLEVNEYEFTEEGERA